MKSLWPLSGSTARGERRAPTSSPSGSNLLRRFYEFTAVPGGGDPLTKTKSLTKIGAFMKCQALLKHSSSISGINAPDATQTTFAAALQDKATRLVVNF